MTVKTGLAKLCAIFGVTRQAFYKAQNTIAREMLLADIVVKLVKNQRKILPRCGGKKLYRMLKPDLLALGLKVGRDGFFDILRENGLLLAKKRNFAKTTNSRHWYRRYGNLIRDLTIERINQVFVSDITYIRTRTGFLFLSIVTDLYSRKIVGFHLSKSLSVDGSLCALKMALKNVADPSKLIHHSDRGIQYSCNEYTKILKNLGVAISMTEENHCYENAVAERVNGILKDEFALGETFADETAVYKVVRQAIRLYNEVRLHMSIGYLTPGKKYAV